MILEPIGYHEQVAATILQRLSVDNLFTIRDHGDTYNVQWSSQAMEQVSAILSECYDMEDDMEMALI